MPPRAPRRRRIVDRETESFPHRQTNDQPSIPVRPGGIDIVVHESGDVVRGWVRRLNGR